MSRCTSEIINIRDVYDAKELENYSPHLNFLRVVDTKTGYRTRQMLVAPVVDAQTKELIGVVQLINTVSGEPFPQAMEEGVVLLCETLAIALRQRQRPMMPIKGKYDGLVANAVTSAEELENAARSARRKNLDIETVLIDEYHVKPGAIGESLAGLFRRSVRAVQAGPRQALRAPQEPEPGVPRKQRLGADRRHQGRHGGADDGSREAQGFARRQQRLPQGEDHLSRLLQSRVHEDARPAVRGDARRDGPRIHRRPPLRHAGRRGERRRRARGHEERGGRQRGRQARQQDHRRRLPAGRVGHSHRAVSRQGQDRDPLPQGRPPAAVHLRPPRLPQRDRRAREDHVRPRHLRAAQAPGREDPVQEVRPARHRAARRQRALAGRPRGHRDAHPRRRRADADRQAGAVQAQPRSVQGRDREALRALLRVRSHGLRQDHDAALGARLSQHADHEDLDRGRPRGDHAARPAPGADESQGGAHLRRRHAGVPALRSRHHHGRRDAGQGNRGDGHRSLAHRPPRVRDAAYEQRAGVDRAAPRHGDGSVQFRRCAARHPRAAAGPAPLPELQEAACGDRRRAEGAAGRIFARARRHRDLEEEPGPGAGKRSTRTGSGSSATRRAT